MPVTRGWVISDPTANANVTVMCGLGPRRRLKLFPSPSNRLFNASVARLQRSSCPNNFTHKYLALRCNLPSFNTLFCSPYKILMYEFCTFWSLDSLDKSLASQSLCCWYTRSLFGQAKSWFPNQEIHTLSMVCLECAQALEEICFLCYS